MSWVLCLSILLIMSSYLLFCISFAMFGISHAVQMKRSSACIKKLENVSCEYDRLNGGWNSTLQAAWYIRRVRWMCLFYISFTLWFMWAKPKIWSLILSFTQKLVRACSMFYPYEGYRSVTPLDAARVNRTIFHNRSVQWYYITLIKGRDYTNHDIIIILGEQNAHRGRWL